MNSINAREICRFLKSQVPKKPTTDNMAEGIFGLLREAPEASPSYHVEQALRWFDSGTASFKGEIHGLLTKAEAFIELEKKIIAEQSKLISQIPSKMTCRVVRLPHDLTGKILFFLFGFLGLACIGAEIASIAFFLRGMFDSVLWALIFCVILFFLPLAEPAFLYSPHISERIRRIVYWAQGPLALVSASIFFGYLIAFGNSAPSHGSWFSKASTSALTTTQLRQLWQGITTFLTAGLFLSFAAAKLDRKESEPLPNSELKEANATLAHHHNNIAKLQARAVELRAALEALDKDRERCRELADGKATAVIELETKFLQSRAELLQNPNSYCPDPT